MDLCLDPITPTPTVTILIKALEMRNEYYLIGAPLNSRTENKLIF